MGFTSTTYGTAVRREPDVDPAVVAHPDGPERVGRDPAHPGGDRGREGGVENGRRAPQGRRPSRSSTWRRTRRSGTGSPRVDPENSISLRGRTLAVGVAEERHVELPSVDELLDEARLTEGADHRPLPLDEGRPRRADDAGRPDAHGTVTSRTGLAMRGKGEAGEAQPRPIETSELLLRGRPGPCEHPALRGRDPGGLPCRCFTRSLRSAKLRTSGGEPVKGSRAARGRGEPRFSSRRVAHERLAEIEDAHARPEISEHGPQPRKVAVDRDAVRLVDRVVESRGDARCDESPTSTREAHAGVGVRARSPQ